MKPAYKIAGLLLIVLFAANALWASPRAEFTKTVKREFAIDANGLAQFITKYGKLDVKTWDQNRVKVEVTIRVQARSEQEAQRVFNQIRIDFTSASNLVKAETIVETSSRWNWWGSNKSDFTVDYEVYIPQTLTLDVAHKYGDVFAASMGGQAIIDLKYGNLRMDEIRNDLKLNLGYGNATIAGARDAELNISYSNLTLAKMRNGKLTTKYSNVSLEEALEIETESKYDTYRMGIVGKLKNRTSFSAVEIKTVDDLSSYCRYTDVKVGTVRNSADLDLEYGGARIDNILRGFSEIRLNGRYSDFKIKVEEGATYQFEASARYAGIIYPSSLKVVSEREQATSHEVSGYAGVANARSVIKAKLDYGGFRMQ
jgi:hypothetical protein